MKHFLFIIKKTLILALAIFMVAIEVVTAIGGFPLLFGHNHSPLVTLIGHCFFFAIGLATLLTTIFHFSLDSLTDYRYKP